MPPGQYRAGGAAGHRGYWGGPSAHPDGPWVWLSLPGPVTVCTAPRAASVPTAEGRGVLTPLLLELRLRRQAHPLCRLSRRPFPHPALSPGERKVVTVLCCAPVIPVADHASDDLDALYSLMQAFYACVQDTVQQYGGTLQPPMGDRVLAMFGAPLAQEDHVVRAGLAALALLQRLNEEPCPAGSSADVRLAVRIGVHTGLMVVGGLGDAPARFTALVGDVTAQAVALQEHAAPGTILLQCGDCPPATGAAPLHGRRACPMAGAGLSGPRYTRSTGVVRIIRQVDRFWDAC